jgi:hypothetical protein
MRREDWGFLGFLTAIALLYLALVSGHAWSQGGPIAPPGIGNTTPFVPLGSHETVSGPTPTLSGCGAGATVVGSDVFGSVVAQNTSCTIVFAVRWNSQPMCIVTDNTATRTGMTALAGISGGTISFGGITSGDQITWNCAANAGG